MSGRRFELNELTVYTVKENINLLSEMQSAVFLKYTVALLCRPRLFRGT